MGAVFDVAPSTAGNWYRQYRRTSSYSALPMGGDRRSKLLKQADWIAERLASTPELTLGEVRDDLAGRGIKVSYASVWRNPIEQVFAKLKALLRRAAPRSFDAICNALKTILEKFKPTECDNYLRHSGYVQA